MGSLCFQTGEENEGGGVSTYSLPAQDGLQQLSTYCMQLPFYKEDLRS